MSRQQSILEGLDTPSHGQRQGKAGNKEGVIGGWVNGSMISAQSGVNRDRIKVTYRVEGEVISAPRKGSGVGQLRASMGN